MKLLLWFKKEWVQIIILAVPYCAAALLWDRLPDRLPNHWNYRGEVDGYAGKVFGTLFLPSVGVVLVLLLPLLRRLDPKCRNYDEETKASIAGVFRTSRLAISLFMTMISLATLAVALQVPVNISRLITGGLGVLLFVMGNCMGRLRPNYFAGFRTPWTLESRTVWLKTPSLGRTADDDLRRRGAGGKFCAAGARAHICRRDTCDHPGGHCARRVLVLQLPGGAEGGGANALKMLGLDHLKPSMFIRLIR